MIKKLITLLSVLTIVAACSQKHHYDENANAAADIQASLIKAKTKDLPVVVIFGANWCSECRALSNALTAGPNAEKISKAFKLVKVNIGNFDTNLDVAERYGNPIQGGIPGAAILSSAGTLLYVTKPGELSTARKEKNIYNFLKKINDHT